MTATLGHVTQLENGAFKGPLRTLNFRCDIEGALERRSHWEKTSHSLLVGAILHGP
ncbi:hypothetical protein [Caulobacter zeae]|uniref:hypothetical protein n=1 Tax=Caulobacter zeae TaxID=2055137 RepID=UPI0013FE0EA1|nr:hypothetical protein [Caulobacter zeae]